MEDTTTTTTAAAETGTAPAPQQSAQTPPQTPPPAEDLSGLVTKESRKAVEKLLRDAGITPDDQPEMQLKEYKKWLDGQKTELQRATDSTVQLTKERDEALRQAKQIEARFAAVAKGIPADRADKYVKLAETYVTEKVPFDQALDAALADFPLTESKTGVPGAGGNPPPAQTPQGRPKGTVIF